MTPTNLISEFENGLHVWFNLDLVPHLEPTASESTILAVGHGELGPYAADLLNNDTLLPTTRVGCGKKREESSA